MTKRKGLHIFNPGDFVLPHPVISLFYKEAKKDDIGIVLRMINSTHNKDFRKIQVFWQLMGEEGIYDADLIFHMHHDYIINEKMEEWEKLASTTKNILNNEFKYHQMIPLFNRYRIK